MKQLIKIKPSRKATLSMCGLGEKTSELISFMKKANVDVLSMVDIRRKDKKKKKTCKKYSKSMF